MHARIRTQGYDIHPLIRRDLAARLPPGALALLRDDGDDERNDDLGVETHRHLDLAELADRVVEHDAAAVDLDPGRLQQCGDDVGRGDRSEELAALARARGDGDAAPVLRRSASSSAAVRSRTSRACRLRRMDSACATTPFVAFIARPRGTR